MAGFVEGADCSQCTFLPPALEKIRARLDQNPEAMRARRSTVEHPFGTIKGWMSATHFFMQDKAEVSAEMALNVFPYNLKRVIAILGVRHFTDAQMA